MLLTIDQAKKYLRLPNTVSAENFNPFIPDATRKYLQPYMGGDLLAKLDSYSGGSLNVTENAAKWDTLLDLTRSALSRFTFFLATPSLDLNITESGILVGNTQSMAPASKERVGSFKDSLEDLGFNALDAVLKHLDENKTVFTDWTASDAYKTFSSGFIRSVDDFQKFVDIGYSRLRFFQLRQAMDRVEMVNVIPVLGDALAAALLTESLTPANMEAERAEALKRCRRCIAYQTAAEEIDEKYTRHAELFINLLRDYLNTNPTKFVELFPEGAIATAAPYPVIENTEDSKIFVFGG